MSDSKTEICQFSLRQLFKSGKYRIPMYQRNYDWGEVEVIQLLEDIIDYSINFPNNNYYLGSLIVVRKNNYYETIDGQQRLTTLNILMCALKSILKEERETQLDWFKQCNITFEFREDSNVTMRKLINGIEDGSNNIINIYHILHKALVKHLKNSNIEQFVDYFLGRVVILRIPLPEDTVLNHYFEIMNSRGEQLEKHEVLKAYLMKLIPSEEHELFNQIWEACSNMNKYVQMEIKKPLRELLFGKDLNSLTNLEFDDIYKRTMV